MKPLDKIWNRICRGHWDSIPSMDEPDQSCAWISLEQELVKRGLLSSHRERPSEAAMRLADQLFPKVLYGSEDAPAFRPGFKT